MLDEINKLKGLQKEYLQDNTDDEEKMKEIKDSKAQVGEGTSSTSSNDDPMKEVDHSEIDKMIEPKKNVVTLKNHAKVVKDKGR